MVFLSRNEIIHHETMLAHDDGAPRSWPSWCWRRCATSRPGSCRWRPRRPSSRSRQPSPSCSASASMPRCWQGSAPPWPCSSPRPCGWRIISAAVPRPAAAFGVPLRAALLPPLALAGAVGPLALSSRPSVAEVGGSTCPAARHCGTAQHLAGAGPGALVRHPDGPPAEAPVPALTPLPDQMSSASMFMKAVRSAFDHSLDSILK